MDRSFSAGQFKISHHFSVYTSPLRLDRNQNGGGIIVLVRHIQVNFFFNLLKTNLSKFFPLCSIIIKRDR